MKKDLRNILQSAGAEELDILLKGLSFDSEESAAEERIYRNVRKKSGGKRTLWRKVAAVAACAAVLMGIGAGGWIYAAESREYRAAVEFFAENNLSLEGLSRGEIKAVYRDITTESFSYDKTAVVIAGSIQTHRVEGILLQGDAENLWNYKNASEILQQSEENIPDSREYRIEHTFKLWEEKGFDVLDKSIIVHMDGESELWRTEISAFMATDYVPVTDGILVWGDTDTWSSEQIRHAWLAKISHEGELLWQLELGDFFHEYIAAVLENEDGTYAVFSRGNLKTLCFSRIDAQGTRLHIQQTEVGNYGIWRAARLGEGYIVQLGSYMEGEYARIVRVDTEGNLTDSVSYEDDKSVYAIQDMLEYGGNLYLSVYAVPKGEETAGGSFRDEIAPVLNGLLDRNPQSVDGEQLARAVRERYTAMLLICRPDDGLPLEFYTAKESLGGMLSVSDAGELLWETEYITDVIFSPYTNAYSLSGSTAVTRYTFGADGLLIGQELTGEMGNYWR